VSREETAQAGPHATTTETGSRPDAKAGRAGESGAWRRRVVALVLVVLSVLWVAQSNDFGPTTMAALLPVLTTAAIYGIGGVGLNLQFGHGGLLNFGFVAFMAVGAYTTVMLIPHLQGAQSTRHDGVLPLVAAIVVGAVLAAGVGALFGIPAIKVRGDYLAIIMIAVAEILRIVLRNVEPVSGGVYGMLGYSKALQDLRPEGVDQLARTLNTQAFQLWLTLVSWAVLVVFTIAIALLVRTPWGRLLRAVRDDEHGVRSLGKSPTRVKLQALMIGGAIGGVSGSLLAFQLSQINPDVFMPQVTFFVFTIVVLGGTSSTWGPAVGSVIFWVLLTQAGALISEHVGSNSAASAMRYILVGLLMGLLVIFRPQGLLGRRGEVVLELK
jgi:neutral amino acid transport system permease protein